MKAVAKAVMTSLRGLTEGSAVRALQSRPSAAVWSVLCEEVVKDLLTLFLLSVQVRRLKEQLSCVGIYECDGLIVVSSRCRWCAAGLGSTSWRVYCCFYSRLYSGTSEMSCFLLWLSLRQCSCLLMSTAVLKIRDALRRLRHFFFHRTSTKSMSTCISVLTDRYIIEWIWHFSLVFHRSSATWTTFLSIFF